MFKMKPINTSTCDLPTLIREGFVYVDKTSQIHELVRPDSDRIYFLSRPRCFGKSLMISTLEQIFKGNRALFKGLAIDKMAFSPRTLDRQIAKMVEFKIIEFRGAPKNGGYYCLETRGGAK